jgi:hypothetical protein
MILVRRAPFSSETALPNSAPARDSRLKPARFGTKEL